MHLRCSFYHFELLFPGIEPATFALLTQCSTIGTATGTIINHNHNNTDFTQSLPLRYIKDKHTNTSYSHIHFLDPYSKAGVGMNSRGLTA